MSQISNLRVDDLSKSLFGQLFSTPQAKSKARSGYARMFNAVLPGLKSDDPRFINFLVTLHDEVNNHTFNTDVSRLKSLSGWKASPAGHTMVNNDGYRSEVMGLSQQGFTTLTHKEIFNDLVDIMFGYQRLVPLRVPSKSSQGLPTLATDREVKIQSIARVLAGDFREVVTAVNQGDGESLLSKGIVCAYVQNFRTSPDKFGKSRKVPDLEWALSGGLSGELTTIDYQDGVPDSRVQACRPRRVMGMHNTLNSMLGVFFGACEDYYLNEYSFTFKHQDYLGMSEKLHSFTYDGIVGVDVSAFDLSVPRWLFTAFFDQLVEGGHICEEFRKFMERIHFAPVFEPENGDGLGSRFIGNPMTIEQLSSPGLLSGVRSVSSLGKLFNTFNLMVLLSESKLYEHNRDNAVKLLKGQLDVKLWNAGDDCLLFFNRSEDGQAFEIALKENLGYFKVEVETPIKFLGAHYEVDAAGFGQFYPDLGSFLVNTFVPERPYTSRLREYWPIGILDRELIYGRNPEYRYLVPLVDEVFKRYFPDFGKFSQYCDKLVDEFAKENKHLLSQSMWDKLFLLNPESIHYKLDVNLISEEVLNLEFNHITVDMQEEFFDFIKGC